MLNYSQPASFDTRFLDVSGWRAEVAIERCARNDDAAHLAFDFEPDLDACFNDSWAPRRWCGRLSHRLSKEAFADQLRLAAASFRGVGPRRRGRRSSSFKKKSQAVQGMSNLRAPLQAIGGSSGDRHRRWNISVVATADLL
jgi:hypothetical protein